MKARDSALVFLELKILSSNANEQTITTHSCMDKCQKHDVECEKPDANEDSLCNSVHVQWPGEGSIGFAFIRPKMPFFGNTFSPKKTPPRKSASLSNLHSLDRSTREVELGLEYGSPTMNLAGQSLKFENGQWIAETGVSGGVDRREVQRLRRRNQQLEEENNLLRLKVDILLDMLSESTAESHLMEKELDELRISRKRK
ncbi:protein chibby homolog 1 isoform X4 [Gorilla gorilla gorilla]|nr:protein chibby homolog 1 isoform X5 [Gorilla gorilla gorilla]